MDKRRGNDNWSWVKEISNKLDKSRYGKLNFTIFMCRRHGLDDGCSIDRTITSCKETRQCLRQRRTTEDRADRCYFMMESDRVLWNPQDPLIPRIQFYLCIFLNVIYKAERQTEWLVQKYMVYNYSFWHVILSFRWCCNSVTCFNEEDCI